MTLKINVIISLWLLFLLPTFAGEPQQLEEILKRIQVKESLHFEYQETQHMELLSRPRQSSGHMLLSPEQMIIDQRAPKRQITVISKNKVLFVDQERKTRRTRKLKSPFAIPGMGPFLQLFYGQSNLAELKRQFTIKLLQDSHHWQLKLSPKLRVMSSIRTAKVSGAPGEGPNQLILEYADGDRTEWQLSPLAHGPDARQEMERLLAQISLQTAP